ncbi:MAG: hypothetical protein LBR94_10305, partial [Desulfovibrio sp.]|nr:hypothetical protein [Desulfovibrio sp.]
LDDIDRLPDTPDSRNPPRGAFTQEQKAIMKEMAQKYNLHDLTSLSALMEAGRASSSAMIGLSAPQATANQLADGIRLLASAYRDALPRMGENKPDGDVAMRVMQEMAMRNAGFTPEQTAALADNLNSDTAATVAGAFLTGAELPGEHDQVSVAWGMTRTLHTTANVLAKGNAEINPLLFTDSTPLSQVPGGLNGCMDILAQMLGETVISPAVQALSSHEPPFGREEWNALLPIAEKAAQGPYGDIAVRWINAAGTDLLAAQRENGGRPLRNEQIWQAVTGFPMPRGVTDDNFGERLVTAVSERYTAARRAAAPSTMPEQIEGEFLRAAGMAGPRQILDIVARPDARLTRADVGTTLEMSSLRGYGPQTAYGLVTDFRRRNAGSHLTFENAQGNGHSIQPFHIADGENTANNPDLQAIVGWARELTHGREVQTARVLQAFSQASTVIAKQFSALFPGNPMSEHGNYAITAREQPDGKVVVDIASDPSTPLDFRLQYTIDTDGSHECTGFEIGRWPSPPDTAIPPERA